MCIEATGVGGMLDLWVNLLVNVKMVPSDVIRCGAYADS